MEKRLAKLYLLKLTEEELEIVWNAFKSAFPSLEHVTLPAIRAAMSGDYATLHDQLDAGSCDGEWRAGYVRVRKEYHDAGGRRDFVEEYLEIIPYVGDRVCQFPIEGYNHQMLINYAVRPSATAAQHVIAWIDKTAKTDRHIYNCLFDAEWS